MDTVNRHFGLVIAYLLPGFIALAGVSPFSPTVAQWLRADQTASLGAPLYALLAATAAGMTVSCFRWLIIDRIHGMTGLGAPAFNPRALEERPAAFSLLVESHYRYYQFYSNTIIAVIWCYALRRWFAVPSTLSFATDLLVLILSIVLFIGSRDALAKYRSRSNQLLANNSFSHSTGGPMTNGIDHSEGATSTNPQKPGKADASKPSAPPASTTTTKPTAPKQ
jgi:hypothetical protein